MRNSMVQTPPLGWNSWDCYGASVTEEEVRANAMYMANVLKPYGWEYVVVDIQWYEPTANSSLYHPFVPLSIDAYSRLIPAVNRFPSSAGNCGFKPLADYVHGLGLKFGIHIMRGIPRQAVHGNTPILGTAVTARDIAHPNSICPWNTDMYGVDVAKPGAQEYYDSLFSLYAEWGVDFVKVDDIAASRLYHFHQSEIELIRKAIDKCDRDMILSLSPGPAPLEFAEFLCDHANMWRMTDDFWDRWDQLLDMFERCERWFPYAGPGHWPDADMLPLGQIGIRSVDGGAANRQSRFTKSEQLTLMTLWCIFRSPLFMGGELRDNDEWTLSLLTNDEVLAVHKHASFARPVHRSETGACWTSSSGDGATYVALFNFQTERSLVGVNLSELGIAAPRPARDLWNRRSIGTTSSRLEIELDAHGAALIRLG